MTAALARRVPAAGWTPRRRAAVFTGLAVTWSVMRAADGDVLNGRGWSSFARFWTAALEPQLSVEFLRLTLDAALVTLGYAVLGTAVSIAVGVPGAAVLSQRMWRPAGSGRGRRGVAQPAIRGVFAVPRAVHEVLWAILLIQVLGFDPLVAVLAIGLPFGAVTAKVYAEILDEADDRPFRALRALGASRTQALLYGLAPSVRADLISYGFYRFECAIRSAAVLGIVGAGGIGFQLALSFQSLRYAEVWTLLAALVLLSGVADAWSGVLRRRTGTGVRPDARRQLRRRPDPVLVGSVVAVGLAVASSWVRLGIDVSALWSWRTARRAVELGRELWPPRTGPSGAGALWSAVVDTLAMSVLALVLAASAGLVTAAVATRRRTRRSASTAAVGARALLLVGRAVPPPVWAFVVVLVLRPGIWPGAVALAAYNLGVLGRLFAEVLEDLDRRPWQALRACGASSLQAFAYGTLPLAAPRLVALALYRWEVLLRETVVVGVVGAGGIGRLVREHLVARDFAAVTGAVAALVALTMAVDAASGHLRRHLR